MPDCQDCKMEDRIKSLEEWRDSSKNFHKDFYDWQRSQIERDARLDERFKNMDTSLSKILLWQEEQQKKPVRRWDALVDKAVWAVLAAVIAFILGRFGL